ncbi:MAG TPA: alpha/beta fold hydrolase [Opitutaceae bacterium]|nr:alpha/beta fold hydrolase [Opitutaceae bacterium]
MVTPSQLPAWLTRLYPFAPQSFVTPGGARMSYLDEGPRSDEAVLMLHGNPTWSFYYRDLVAAVAPQLRCIVPDHIGMGLSDKPQDYSYTLATRIADIEALVASLGLKRVHLVVHDWGGAIGFGFATRHPEMIGRLVVLNTAAFPAKPIPLRIALCRLPGLGPLLVRGLNGFAGPATWMAMNLRTLTRHEKRAYLFPYDSWDNRVAVDAFVRDIPRTRSHPSWETLETIGRDLDTLDDHPVLIVWGGRDFCFNYYFLGRWLKIFPKAQLRPMGQAGHYVLEDAGPKATAPIAAFLAEK